ncbi:MAG: amidohydrolase family protein [Pseudomonadota bacterium]
MKIKIEGGKLYDPRNNLNGEERNIFVEDGIIVDAFSTADKTIDARSKTVMAGGIDIQSHVATYGLNLIRATGRFYSPREIGYIYAKMGYTHVNEPFMTQLTANYVHHELSSIPILDTSSFLVLNLRDVQEKIKSTKYLEEFEKMIPIMMGRTKAIGVKIYEPFVRYTQRTYVLRNVSTKKVLSFFSGISKGSTPRVIMHTSSELLGEEIGYPAAFHFSSVGSAISNDEAYQKLVTFLNAGASVDLGLFDFEQNLRISSPKQAYGEICGSIDMGFSEPIVFSRGKVPNREIPFLAFKLALSQPVGSISFSTDSPTNASFAAYPKIFSWLMKAENRANLFDKEPPDFEYSLLDIARITRQNPADLLGLINKGHLGPGAEADISIYDIDEDTTAGELEARFRDCAYLIKGGNIVIEDHKVVDDQVQKKTYYRGMEPFDDEPARGLAKYSTLRFENLAVDQIFTANEVRI